MNVSECVDSFLPMKTEKCVTLIMALYSGALKVS